MRLAIDARAAEEVPAGRGRLVRELLGALARRSDDHRYLLLCREPWREAQLDARFAWVRVPLPDPLWHVAAAAWASSRADVLFSTNSYLTAWFSLKPTAIFVHDLIAFIPGARAQTRAARIEKATIRPALRRARLLICNSHATERDLVERFPVAAGRMMGVPMGADERFGAPVTDAEVQAVRARHGVPGPFVLSVGTLEPRKNLVRLIDAWTGIDAPARGGHELVLVGPKGWELDEIAARTNGARGAVRTLGFVSDDDLAALYHACTAFAYPSLYEGFGLPVLEALQAGAPTLTSSVSSLPEVAGDAALLVDPRDEGAIRSGLMRL